MTYGRVATLNRFHNLDSAAVSHSAELVRGNLILAGGTPPHPVLWTTFSPRGEGSLRLAFEHYHHDLSHACGASTTTSASTELAM